jgi:hypothetical protein
MNKPTIRFMAAIKHMNKLFSYSALETDISKKEAVLSFITIKLHDQWNFRCRQLVLLGYGRTQTEMLKKLRKIWSSSKVMDNNWEPDWHIPSNSIRAAKLLSARNMVSIQNALGSITCIDDIRWTRNAIVHNIPNSYIKYKAMTQLKYGLKNIEPYNLILQYDHHINKTIYQYWCEEILNALKYAI